MKGFILVVSHKRYSTPIIKPYKSIAVGKNKEIINADFRDDMGENISSKNANYCELTAQFWAWKNSKIQYDYVGLCHYRRFFGISWFRRFKIINCAIIEKYLNHHDIILPQKWYWNVSVRNYYSKFGKGKDKDLLVTREVLSDLYPDYVEGFDKILSSCGTSYCNMFIMKYVDFCRYNEWIFRVLAEVESRIDISNYDVEEARVFAYLSEILINVWVKKNNLKVKFLPMIESEYTKVAIIKGDLKNIMRRLINLQRMRCLK